jgi:tRNA-dependent cyclodipeptide synthase
MSANPEALPPQSQAGAPVWYRVQPRKSVTLVSSTLQKPMLSAPRTTVRQVAHAVSIDPAETHGTLIDTFLAGEKYPAFLAISPTSSARNFGRLLSLLDWLLPHASRITILEGSFLARWNLLAINQSLDDATANALASRKADAAARRIQKVMTTLNARDVISFLDWRNLLEDEAFRNLHSSLRAYMEGSPSFAESLRSTARSFQLRKQSNGAQFQNPNAEAFLAEYVLEEVAAILHLTANQKIPIEVYPGPDLPLLKDIVAGTFRGFPVQIPERTHIALKLKPNRLRPALPTDLQDIIRLAQAWPTHFVPAAIPLIEADFATGHTIVWQEATGLSGFVIWDTDGDEMELKWLAVAPRAIGNGIGSSLVNAALKSATTERRVILYSATTDSIIPGTFFNAALYDFTHRFFVRNGFHEERRLESFWSPTNHALLFVREL